MIDEYSIKPARLLILLIAAAACGPSAHLPLEAGIGPSPALPQQETSLIPVVKVANAVGWSDGGMPSAGDGLRVGALATKLEHPRFIYVLPNNDVLVAETNAPVRPDDGKGIRAWFVRRFMKKAGAAVPSANRITLLRDADGDGVADLRSVFLDSLNSPFGIALVGNTLYVANTDAVVKVPYNTGDTRASARPTKLTDLPAGTINHHWTKTIVASPDGSKLYASVGSNSNVAENGIDKEDGRAAIWEIDLHTGAKRVFATGLRNAVGLTFEPTTGRLWAAVNERDELGSDLVPDYMTSVRDGAFYGWPYSYYGGTLDPRVKPQRLDLVARAVKPDYALGPHTASLGLTWSGGSTSLPQRFQHGMFVGQHGSWNRKPLAGYRVIFVPFENGMPSGSPVVVLNGFLDQNDHARGRPVGVAIDKNGSLLVADDVGNAVWRVTSTITTAKRRE